MNIEINLAKSEDVENILELQAISLKVLSSKIYNNRQIDSLIRSQNLYRLKNLHNETIFVAYYCAKLVGFASLSCHPPNRINAIFVHPDFTRLGIGTKLLKTLENIAIERRYRTLYVMSSLMAVEFYQAMGYKKNHRSGFWSEGNTWIPCVIMKKQLISLTEQEKLTQRIILCIICLVIFAFILLHFVK